MIDRINTDTFEEQCKAKDIGLEELASSSGVHIKTLERAQTTGYIKSKELKSVCKALGIEPKELTRKMPISFGSMSGLD